MLTVCQKGLENCDLRSLCLTIIFWILIIFYTGIFKTNIDKRLENHLN